MKPAFLIVDMQKEYYKGAAVDSMTSASEYINEVLGYFREKELPVVWIQDIDRDSGVVPGTAGFDVIESLGKLEDEITIFKEYGNSFNRTECGNYLKKENVDLVLISGYCAEHCVLSTYLGAKDLDFTPVLLKNGVAGGDTENLRFVEKICDTVSYGIVKKMLENI